MAKAYKWRGVWDPAGGWQEWFGGPDGLPPRDLTAEDVASLTDEQREKLTSPAGERLYEPLEKKADAGKAGKDDGDAGAG